MYTGADYGTHSAVSQGSGLYQVTFMFEIAEAYEINVLFGGSDIKGSPVDNIDVLVGLVQARYSDLLEEVAELTAGQTVQWKIQAKDIFENVVLGTEERFSL